MNSMLMEVVNMRISIKSRLGIVLITLTVASATAGVLLYLKYLDERLLYTKPAPFRGKIISFEKLLEINKVIEEERNLTLYLPAWLPEGYKLSAIWVKRGLNDSEWGFPIILVYSKDNYTDYRYKPGTIGFEIYPASSMSTGWLNLQIKKWNSSCDYISVKISDDIYGIIYKRAAAYYEGKVYRSPLAVLYVKGWSYMISADNLGDLMKIIESLRPIDVVNES